MFSLSLFKKSLRFYFVSVDNRQQTHIAHRRGFSSLSKFSQQLVGFIPTHVLDRVPRKESMFESDKKVSSDLVSLKTTLPFSFSQLGSLLRSWGCSFFGSQVRTQRIWQTGNSSRGGDLEGHLRSVCVLDDTFSIQCVKWSWKQREWDTFWKKQGPVLCREATVI